jgi:hypothetical protein
MTGPAMSVPSARSREPRYTGLDKVGYAHNVEPEPWMASDDFGAIERSVDESIVTCFYCIGLPLWPRHSVYVTRRDGAEYRIPIPLQRKSVMLGYLRKPLWFAAVVLGSPAIAAPARWAWLMGPALALAATAAVLTFVAGRLTPSERERRALLRRIVGVGAPPELLPPQLRAALRHQTESAWRNHSIVPWRQAIERGEASELLIALAEYDAAPALVERARASFDRFTN